jgi:hypothetical protein
MKRRKAIGSIVLAGAAVAAGYGGYEWFNLTSNPDKNFLLGKKALLAELAETIIPATDTPGAKESGAVEFMLRLLDNCTDTKTLNKFVTGLQELEVYTRNHHHREFIDCTANEKQSVLQYFDLRSRTNYSLFEKVKTKYTGRPFFETLKIYSVQGYCISEKGASLGMRYIAVPGRYLSCIPLESNQKAWATK